MTAAADARPTLRRAGVLRRTDFRRLFLANLASGTGNWLALIALQVDVYDRTHSGSWVAALLIANLVPAVALGLLFGPLVDRLSRKALMVGSDLGRLGVFCALPFAPNATTIVLLSIVAGIGNAFFRPAVIAGTPNLVADDELPDANALLQLVEWITTAGGPVLGGVIVAASGPHLAYWVNAATFAVSAAFVVAIPARRLQSDRPIGRGHWADLREGFDAVIGSRPLAAVLTSWSVAAVAVGLVNVAEIFLARRTLHGGALAFGLLWMGSGLGQIAGGLNAQSLADRLGTYWLYPRALLVSALGIAIAAAAPDVPVAIAGMLVSGIGNGAAIVLNITLVQRGAADTVRGRALTTIMSANVFVLLLAFLGAGPLTNAAGARVAFAAAAGALVAAAAAALAVLPRAEEA